MLLLSAWIKAAAQKSRCRPESFSGSMVGCGRAGNLRLAAGFLLATSSHLCAQTCATSLTARMCCVQPHIILYLKWHVLLLQTAAASSNGPGVRGSRWLLRALAALDVADGRLEAAEVLLAAIQRAAAVIADHSVCSNAAGGSAFVHFYQPF